MLTINIILLRAAFFPSRRLGSPAAARSQRTARRRSGRCAADMAEWRRYPGAEIDSAGAGESLAGGGMFRVAAKSAAGNGSLVVVAVFSGVGVMFHWVATVYSIRSAWLATAMVLIEPTWRHTAAADDGRPGGGWDSRCRWATWRFVVSQTFRGRGGRNRDGAGDVDQAYGFDIAGDRGDILRWSIGVDEKLLKAGRTPRQHRRIRSPPASLSP